MNYHPKILNHQKLKHKKYQKQIRKKMLNHLQHSDNITQRKLNDIKSQTDEEFWLKYVTDVLRSFSAEVSEGLFEIADDIANELKLALATKDKLTYISIIGSMNACGKKPNAKKESALFAQNIE